MATGKRGHCKRWNGEGLYDGYNQLDYVKQCGRGEHALSAWTLPDRGRGVQTEVTAGTRRHAC